MCFPGKPEGLYCQRGFTAGNAEVFAREDRSNKNQPQWAIRWRAVGDVSESVICHLSPFWTTRFLQVLQQEQAWLHSNSTGGSLWQKSRGSRPSYTHMEKHVTNCWHGEKQTTFQPLSSLGFFKGKIGCKTGCFQWQITGQQYVSHRSGLHHLKAGIWTLFWHADHPCESSLIHE